MANKKPVHQIRLGRIRAAIWANESGDEGLWFNVTISRLYHDESEGWKDSTSFRRDDLPLVAKVADMAYAWIWNNRQATPSPEQIPPTSAQVADDVEF